MRYKVNPPSEEELRQRARQRFGDVGQQTFTGSCDEATQLLLEGMAISKIELEMQIEHLQDTRAKLEIVLRQSSEQFDFAPVGLLKVDAQGIINKSNLVASNMLELERSRLMGQCFDQFVQADQRDRLRALMAQAAQLGDNQRCELALSETRLLTRHVQVDLAPLAPGQGHLLALVDITERTRIERQLREDEERWRLSVDAIGDGVWDWNARTAEVHYSNGLLQLYGYTPEDFRKTLDAWRELLHPEDQPVFMLAMQACLSGQTSRLSVEQRVRCHDGSWKWIHCRGAVASLAQDGTAERLIGTHMDITGRKLMEIHLQEENAVQRATLDALPSRVAVLNSRGELEQTNSAWNACFTPAGHAQPAENGHMGSHYAQWLGQLLGAEPALQQQAMDAIAAVIALQHPGFQQEYVLRAEGMERRLLLQAVPVRDGTGRTLVCHQDITQSHVNRVQGLAHTHAPD